MKIVIIGELYSKNLGDGIICRCVEDIVKRYVSDKDEVECIDLSCRTNYETVHGIETDLKTRILSRIRKAFLFNALGESILKKIMGELTYTYWRWYLQERLQIVSFCKKHPADIVVFAGGELFKDYFVYRISCMVDTYQKMGSSVYFNACGIDSKNTPYLIRKFKKVIGKDCVVRVTTRNKEDIARALLGDEYQFVPDSAICCSEAFHISKDENSGCVGLGIMSIPQIDEVRGELLQFWKTIIDYFRNKGISFKLFTNGEAADNVFLKEVADYCSVNDGEISPFPETPKELIQLIAGFKSICAFRLHALIVASSLEIPFVGFEWDKKQLDFAECIGQEESIHDWGNTTPEKIFACLCKTEYETMRFSKLKNKVKQELKRICDEEAKNTDGKDL